MNKIYKLTKNELIKIFARPLIYIMLILIIVLTFGNAFLTSFVQKQESNNYEQNWQNALNSRLQSYNSVLSENSAPAEELERAKYGVETVQYMIDNNIRETDWKAAALNTILDLKMEKYLADQSGDAVAVKELNDTIGQLNAYIEQDNWKGYIETMRSRTAADMQLDKNEREARVEIYDMRLKYSIVPSPMPEMYSYGYQQPWQEGVLESLQSALSSQKSGLNAYGQKLSEEESLQLKNTVAELKHRIETSNPPNNNDTMGNYLSSSSSLVGWVSLLIVVIAGTIAATEYTTGTVKLLLISPAKRWKILLSKYLAVMITALIMLVLLFFSSMLAGGTFFGFGNLVPYLSVENGAVTELPYLLYAAFKYLLCVPQLLIMTSIALMLSVIMRHSAFAVGVGAAFTFGGQILSMLIRFIPYDWKRFLLHANLDLTVYFQETVASNNMMMEAQKPMEGMSLAFSLIVLAVYFICINYITLDSFNRRDIK